MSIDSSEKYKLLLPNSSRRNKFTQMGFQKSPIDPKGSISTTLATPGLDQLAAAINSP
ncbi:hypothetical protein T12_1499 [Trichinella patagoniensis]|uniref:Uncharacterized protein n=1 Tax=Trichinella patagoniensis TaxID=990121 RepID=A0A0V0ZSP7_9BILA|nr:hypothetical protein T12_1499 [Trichinella patagoniensis]